MRSVDWNRWITVLTLVHFGQQLGAEGRFARTIYDAIEMLVAIWR